jgi:hypothetical protein
MTDHFARTSAKRAWNQIQELMVELRELRQRIQMIEERLPNRCVFCGAPASRNVCRAHADLVEDDEI